MAIRPKYGAYGTIGPARGFTWDEVRSGDGKLPRGSVLRYRFRRQARLLNRLRAQVKEEYGGSAKVKRVSINVTSWYRSPAYNALIGGARFSQHVYGRATDITVTIKYQTGSSRTLSPYRVAKFAKSIGPFDRGGIGTYDRAHGWFAHLDYRPNGPARWHNG